jgi:hypothetical protein
MPLFLVAFADAPADDASVPVMHAQARVVQVDVVVTDLSGKPVTGLSKDDFTLTDNNKPRGIDIFSVGSEQTTAVTPPSEPLPPHAIFKSQSTLSLSERSDGWAGSIEETFIETNDSGATLAKVSDKKEFDVPPATRARFDADGVAWPFSVPLVEGAGNVTIIVRDTKSGRVGSLTVPLK